jgi:hypothetical protein
MSGKGNGAAMRFVGHERLKRRKVQIWILEPQRRKGTELKGFFRRLSFVSPCLCGFPPRSRMEPRSDRPSLDRYLTDA